ncbi:MAG: DNA alkylation repair protein [Candidatus Methanofastidiosa archaeon]|nr:DNA alkylation repair protein [Candidatus Methanofastidiosa archaeon]
MEYNLVLQKLKSLSNPDSLEGMARYGINTDKAFGISIPALRNIAKEIGNDHNMALKLWKLDYHETKILASMIEDSKILSEDQMEEWVKDFDSWDVCDQTCNNLFRKSPLAFEKSFEWSKRDEEYVKRAGFVLMANLAVHDKKRKDKDFELCLKEIYSEASDSRLYVKKAVNWALRQIGKRNIRLNKKAIETATNIQKLNSKSAKWIAGDALRELNNPKILSRIKS